MFGKWPTRILVSPETGPDTNAATKIDDAKIDIFIRECRSCQRFGATAIVDVVAAAVSRGRFISKAARPEFPNRSDTSSGNLKAANRRPRDRNCAGLKRARSAKRRRGCAARGRRATSNTSGHRVKQFRECRRSEVSV